MSNGYFDQPGDDWDDVLRWHFAIVGLDINRDEFEIGPGIAIQRIEQLPTSESLASCLSHPMAIGLVQHYVDQGMIRYELVVDTELLEENIAIPELADLVVTSIGIKTKSELFCLVACEQSWGQLSKDAGRSYRTRVENSPYVPTFHEPSAISDDELHWVSNNLNSILDLNTQPQFAIAFKSFSTQMHCPDLRMAATQIWAGVESLIEGRFQVSYSLSLLAAFLLEPRGPNCEQRRRAIRKLYDQRSDIVHGRPVTPEFLNSHIEDARRLLGQLLTKFIELGKIFDNKEIHTIATHPPPGPDDSELASLDSSN